MPRFRSVDIYAWYSSLQTRYLQSVNGMDGIWHSTTFFLTRQELPFRDNRVWRMFYDKQNDWHSTTPNTMREGSQLDLTTYTKIQSSTEISNPTTSYYPALILGKSSWRTLVSPCGLVLQEKRCCKFPSVGLDAFYNFFSSACH